VNVTVIAFGFKYGVPRELDLLFDVRFLQNPNYDPLLQPRTGSDPDVGAFIERDPALAPFLSRLFPLIDFLLPQYERQGKDRTTIGFGCTGGRHRSLYIARRLAQHLHASARTVECVARDLEAV
jgi:UPF0042 nucleotide-binding protein